MSDDRFIQKLEDDPGVVAVIPGNPNPEVLPGTEFCLVVDQPLVTGLVVPVENRVDPVSLADPDLFISPGNELADIRRTSMTGSVGSNPQYVAVPLPDEPGDRLITSIGQL